MDPPHVTQQTSTALPLRTRPTPGAPWPKALGPGTFRGPLQWALEGSGWTVVRQSVDFALLCVAVVLAQGGVQDTLHTPAVRAPLLALPLLVMLLFHLRGLYRTRLRALVLDGIVPVVSGVSVGAMAVAMIGLFANGRVPDQSVWVRAWLFSLIGVGFGRIVLSLAQRSARARRLVGKPVL